MRSRTVLTQAPARSSIRKVSSPNASTGRRSVQQDGSAQQSEVGDMGRVRTPSGSTGGGEGVYMRAEGSVFRGRRLQATKLAVRVAASDTDPDIFFPSGRGHTILLCDWSSDVCSSD